MLSRGDANFDKLVFTGDIYETDSFSLAVSAACKYLGIDVHFQTIELLAGNTFAPNVRPSEPCRCSWALQGLHVNLDLVLPALGVSYYPFIELDRPTCMTPKPVDAAQRKRWERKYYREPVLRTIDSSIADGKLILSMGEWYGDHQTSWTEWGFPVYTVPEGTQRRPDGGIFGLASSGPDHVEVDFIRDGFIIYKSRTPSLVGIDKEILQRAVLRISGDCQPWATDARGIAYGLKAMDAWIDTMDNEVFCPEPRMARNVAQPFMKGFERSALHLDAMAQRQPAAAYLLRFASSLYLDMASLLSTAVSYNAINSYEQIIGDMDKQREHSNLALRPIREKLRTICECLQDAMNLVEYAGL